MPRVTSTDEIFKKSEQVRVVGCPETTAHDINDEYFRHPPINEENASNVSKLMYHSANDEKRDRCAERDMKASTLSEAEENGNGIRISKTDELSFITQDNSVDIVEDTTMHEFS